MEVIVEKKRYASEGIHKGMHGWICDDSIIDGYRLVNFPRHGELKDIATLAVLETDMVEVSTMDVFRNEQILTDHGK